MAYDSTLDPRREKLDRLLLVIDALEHSPPDLNYRQSMWRCGTNACALGFALVKYGRIGDLHLEPVKSGYNGGFHLYFGDTNQSENLFVDIADTFGITGDEAERVFGLTMMEDTIHLDGSRTKARALTLLRELHAKKVAELAEA